jgi:multiple sugar transport system permease protein
MAVTARIPIKPAEPAVPPRRRSVRLRIRRDAGRFVTLVVLAVLFIGPIYWMISTSLKTEADAIALPVQWLPDHPTIQNYQGVLADQSGLLIRWAFNSVLVAIVFTILYVGLCALTAYPLARMRFPGRDAWFAILLASMMIPGIVTLIPTYVMALDFGWLDTYQVLIVPFLPGAFGVFMLRQYFLTIPRELEDAARIDGANALRVLRHVVLPLSIPALVALGVFTFLFSWNNYLWPLFVVHGEHQTLPVGLATAASRYVTQYGQLMASTALAAIPAVIVYLIAQRYLVQGISLTGIKE